MIRCVYFKFRILGQIWYKIKWLGYDDPKDDNWQVILLICNVKNDNWTIRLELEKFSLITNIFSSNIFLKSPKFGLKN